MRPMSRRELLIAGGGLVMVSACGSTPTSSLGSTVSPSDPAIVARETQRSTPSAHVVTTTVTAAPVDVEIGGGLVSTVAFGDRPGAGAIRARAGDILEARFINRLPDPSTIHWHGIALRNDMDGVHDLTQAAVPPRGEFVYRFTLPDAGTYWFHPHMGLDLDRGLYAPLIVEDPDEPLAYDVDATLVLDDWLDGYGRSPEQVLDELQSTGGHSGHDMGDMGGMGGSGGMGVMMGGFTGDVAYPLHLINGRAPVERDTIAATPGQRVRLRIINAGSDTAYRVAVAGHRLTVTHTDGFPVQPVEVDHLVLGMGERYDVLLTAGAGAFPIVAVPEGKDDPAGEAVLRTTGGSTPATGTRPNELTGQAVSYTDLHALQEWRLDEATPDRTHELHLTAASGYTHGIDGKRFPDSDPIVIHDGERLRVRVVNDTMMFHPVHLHGHTFQLNGAGSARKDTVNVMPMSAVEFDVQADNPGQWMFHCHNTYHLETGMATLLSYRA